MYYDYRFSRGDGALLINQGTGKVDAKLRGSLEAGQVGYSTIPFASLGIPLPPGVLLSLTKRHSSLWGRYQ